MEVVTLRWNRLVGVGGAAVALAVLVGCGGSGGSGGSTAAGGATVSARNIPGVGSTLVNSDGMTLYFADQETGGQIKCVSDCLKFWQPLNVPGGTTPTAGAGVGGTLATISRPDGASQVTYDGKPLYAFTQDGAGKAAGNGFKDSFGGVEFVWHAAAVSGAAPAGPTSAPTATDNGGGNGYGY
jgi:predicted lipoprotein with Yx(FWY)xxD motif